jgi:hypothetical protein
MADGDTPSNVQVIKAVAGFNGRLSVLEEQMLELRALLIKADTGCVRSKEYIRGEDQMEIVDQIYKIIAAHPWLTRLYVNDDVEPTKYHLQPPPQEHCNENCTWNDGKIGTVYLGGLQVLDESPLLWRQIIIPRLITNEIRFVFPAPNAMKRMPITSPKITAVIVALDPSVFSLPCIGEIVRSVSIGIPYVFVVCEDLTGVCLPNKTMIQSTFRHFCDRWYPRQEADEVYKILKYILFKQCGEGSILQTMDECVKHVCYKHKKAIFGGGHVHLVDVYVQLDILAYLFTQPAPISDTAWIVLYAYAKLVLDRAADFPNLIEHCKDLGLKLQDISLYTNYCHSLLTREDVSLNTRAMLGIIFSDQ